MASKDFVPLPKKVLKVIAAEWEELNKPKRLNEEKWVDLIFKGIHELDTQTLNSFQECTKLSLSSNLIVKLPEFNLKNLEILSLSRNKIK
jgi:Leucine-rich repeat (LRR) protein